jgi:adenylyltransferase/sulfurtransferase
MDQITAPELKARLDAGDDIQLVDVRQPNEHAFARIEGSKLISLGEIIGRMDEIDQDRETVVYCHTGMRSARAIQALQQYGFTGKLSNLVGGIAAWSDEVDPTVPQY